MMIEGANFALFVVGALALNLTPGPDMAFTLASTARGGVRSGIMAALGVGTGCLSWAVAAAAGLTAMLAASEHALTVVRVLGGAYLIYLAIKVLLEKSDPVTSPGSSGLVRSFQDGVVTNLFNPKVGLFFLAFLPGFVSADAAQPALQVLFLGAVFSVLGSCVLVVVALLVGALRNRFSHASSHKGMKAVSATIYGALGIYLLASNHR